MKNIHAGHRQRLGERFDRDPGSIADHELLELLLFYSVDLRDTNVIAHNLLNSFLSIRGVLTASPNELMDSGVITAKSARLIKILCEFVLRYNSEKKETPNFYTMAEAAEYIIELFSVSTTEEVHMFCLDIGLKLIGHKILNKGDAVSVSIQSKTVAQTALNTNAVYVVLAHNHPGGSPIPSGADIKLTNAIKNVLESVGVKLVDHLIIAGRKFYSFREKGSFNIDDIEAMAYAKMYDGDD